MQQVQDQQNLQQSVPVEQVPPVAQHGNPFGVAAPAAVSVPTPQSAFSAYPPAPDSIFRPDAVFKHAGVNFVEKLERQVLREFADKW